MGSATLPAPGPHWVWVDDIAFGNIIDGRAYLVDADSGRMLGMLSTGSLFLNLELPRDYSAIYAAETYYSRGTRGTRTDVITRYDPRTLEPVDEIVIPPKRQAGVPMLSYTGLTDDQRFMVVYNFTPAQSVSVADLSASKLAGEIATPGCALVYPSGPRRFSMLCADGRLLSVDLAEDGSEASRAHERALLRRAEGSGQREGRPRREPLVLRRPSTGWSTTSTSPAPRRSFAKPWSIVSAQERAARLAHRRRTARGGPRADGASLLPDAPRTRAHAQGAGPGGLGVRHRQAASACSA